MVPDAGAAVSHRDEHDRRRHSDFSDVTAIKQAEGILREAQAYFESIVQTVREPLVILDREFRVVSANGAFYETFGITPADAERQVIYGLGNGAWDIAAAARAAREDPAHQLAVRSLRDRPEEVQRGLRAVVDFLEVDRGCLIEFARAGKGARCWAIEDWMDVEDFPWMAARLQRGDFVTVSRLEELPDEAAKDRQSYLAYRVKPQVALPLEAGGRIVGGLVFSTIGDDRATSDDLKRQLDLVGEVFANLLSRKMAEVELQRLREDLGHVNRVSTIGELTTSLAHELNQPLTAILSCAQAGQRLIDVDSMDRGEFREILGEIVEDGRRAAAVIDRLRALLKKGDPQLTVLDLNETVAEVVRLIRSDALVRDISIRLELDPTLSPVRGDRVQLQQVLLNLALNGMDAMQELRTGERTLVFRTAMDRPGAIRVSVRDSGVGIRGRDVEPMFQPFYTTKAGGMGIGLTIARSIIEAHDGEMEAANNPDGGATFSFTLPVSEERP